MTPKFELGEKLYCNYNGYWQACWAVAWYFHERYNSIYTLSDKPYGGDLRRALEEDLITSSEYQQRLKNGRIRLEVKDPIGHKRYLMLIARDGYPSESSN